MSGICLAVQLKRAGITSFKIVEELPDVGGTWLQNTYPGAACDIPAFLYSYSFAPNYDWSHKFAPQSEILDYFTNCVDKFDIRSHIEFGVSIARAEFDEESLLWRVTDSKGCERTANVFVSAVGQLNRPNIPDIEGLQSFQGRAFHSARWRHDCDLRGRRVGVIGVGASAIQLIPKIAPDVERLVVFQRTANWVYPLHNFGYPAWVLRLFRSVKWLERFYRWWLLLLCDARSLLFGKESWLNRGFTGVLWLSMRRRFAPKLRDKLIPSHAAGCKRTLLSSEYSRALTRQNVQLVDQSIRRIERDGIRTDDAGFHQVDTIILATGFETTKFLFPMEIVGRDRILLSEAWKPRPRTYWGIMTPGFPNFFVLYGPNTNLGHNSIILMVESQVRYVMSCLREMERRDSTFIEPREAAVEKFDQMLQTRLDGTVFAGDCRSWYKTADGGIVNNWCSSALEYRWRTRKPKLEDFHFRHA
jgi:cation diffusion facilitator CzcD-associated flavoprotein CzcO